MERLLRNIIALLSQHPRLTLRSGRDAWLTSLPRAVREGLTRADDVRNDLSLILDSALPIQLRDGRWAVLVLLDEILPDMMELADGPRLKTLRDQLESNLVTHGARITDLSSNRSSEKLDTVQLILDGRFEDFNAVRRDETLIILATLLHVESNSIRISRVLPGSIILELQLEPLLINELVLFVEQKDPRLLELKVLGLKLSNGEYVSIGSSRPLRNPSSATNHYDSVMNAEMESLMPDRQRWLTDLEFAIDPFAYLYGAQDPNILRYYFRIPNFYEIVGDATKLTPIFVFGAEGSGKSSLRNAVAQMAKRIPVLSVVFRFLDPLAKINAERNIQRTDHIAYIVKEIFDTLIHELETDKERANFANRESTRFLSNFIWTYAAKYVTAPLQRRRISALLNPDDTDPKDLPEYMDERELLGNLCAAICEVFNYQAVYFLVDPDPITPPVTTDTLWSIIKPLMDSSSLLDLADFKAAFKFFLDDSLMDRSLAIEWIALNRTKMLYTLTWTSTTLRQLLRDRLRLSSNKRPPHVSLGEFSEANDLDDIVVSISAGSPRQLIAVCNRLLLAHLSQPYDGSRKLIERTEINQVLKEVKQGPSQIEAIKILDGTRNLDQVTLQRLIWQGENDYVEFKSSLRYNLFSGNRDVKLEQTIAQEICGFANTRGGFLIIGIDNNGNALGLENDYKTIGKERQNEDGYRLAVTDIIASFLDRPPEGLHIQFEDYNDKRVCIVCVRKSREPLYCLIDQKAEFFTRLDNSARRLDVRQALQYVKGNFEKY